MGESRVKPNNRLSWLLPVYILLMVAAGAVLAYRPLLDYCSAFFHSQSILQESIQLAVLAVIMVLCRSLPMPTRTGDGMDISNVAIIASFLAKGPGATIVVLLISTFFKFDRQDGKIIHVFNTPLSKTLFNDFNLIISVVLGTLVFTAAGGTLSGLAVPYYHVDLPQALAPTLLYLLASMFSESIFMAGLLLIRFRMRFWKTLFEAMKTFLPVLLAFAPLGYFLTLIFSMPGGPYMALLFFVPLLFARYAYKLYLDSKEQYLRTISTLTTAIEAKDEYTEGHSQRVAQYAVELGQAMGLAAGRVENIKVASVLHDIGKIGIDDEILRKPGKLTQAEWAKIMEHPAIGVKILEEVTMPGAVKDMIYYHHVRYDGGGYPAVARGVKIPMEVYIIGLADAYDAMTSNRPYRAALAENVALDIIREERGKQFHPEVVDTFLKMKNSK